MRYISLDPATKSIAVAVVDVANYSISQVIATITTDLAPEKNSKEISDLHRIELLTAHTVNIFDKFATNDDDVTLLIEKQISGTDTYICFITILTVATMRKIKTVIIDPAKKNQLTINGFKVSDFYKKTLNSYTANKEHSRAIFLSIKDTLPGKENISYNKKYEKDLSDCFTQLLAYLMPLSTNRNIC